MNEPAFKIGEAVSDGWVRDIFRSETTGNYVYAVEEAETESLYLISEEELLDDWASNSDLNSPEPWGSV